MATKVGPTRVLISGGLQQGSKTLETDGHLEVFDSTSPNQATVLKLKLRRPRHTHTATLLPDGRVLVIGGCQSTLIPSPTPGIMIEVCDTQDTAELLDLERQTSTLLHLPEPLYGHTSSLLPDGRVLVIGGKDGAFPTEQFYSSVTLIDPVRQTVKTIDQLPKSRSAHTTTVLDDGSVLIVGGWWGQKSRALTAWRFYPLRAEAR